jgi:type IV pilus assembly protein PilE
VNLASRQRQAGFTLVELVVVMLVVAILAGIAYPSYLNFTRRANRTDATRTLMQDAQVLERCYSQTFSYVGCPNIVYAATPTPNGYYTVTVVAAVNPNGYTITAVPAGPPQNADAPCTSFTLASGAGQTSTGTGGNATCWGSN